MFVSVYQKKGAKLAMKILMTCNINKSFVKLLLEE